MKRFLCPKHIHHLKIEGKSVLLSTSNCTICKWEKRPKHILDIAQLFENVAIALRDDYKNPYYDPHGFIIRDSVNLAVKEYLKKIHPDYHKMFIDTITNKETV